jgi:hypothetical protein
VRKASQRRIGFYKAKIYEISEVEKGLSAPAAYPLPLLELEQ